MSGWRWIGPLGVLAVWSALTYGGVVRPLFLPTPGAVVAALANGFSTGELAGHMGATLLRLVGGYSVGIFVGLPIGLAMGYSRRTYESLEGLVDFFRSVPVTSLFPMFLLLFGIGDVAKVAIAAWSSAFLIVVNTMYGVRHGSETRRIVARVMRANGIQVFAYVVVPDALPEIFAGLRTGLSLALIVVVVSEMFLGTTRGLGQVIFNSSLLYEASQMYGAILITGALGYGLNRLLLLLEAHTVHWKGKS